MYRPTRASEVSTASGILILIQTSRALLMVWRAASGPRAVGLKTKVMLINEIQYEDMVKEEKRSTSAATVSGCVIQRWQAMEKVGSTTTTSSAN